MRLDLHPGLSRAEKGGGCIVLDKLTRVQRAFRRRQRRAERGARDLKRRAVLLGEDFFNKVAADAWGGKGNGFSLVRKIVGDIVGKMRSFFFTYGENGLSIGRILHSRL